MQTLSSFEQELHEQALKLSQDHRRLEWEILQVLMRVEYSRLYRKLGKPSLFQYSVDILGFSEAVAYCFQSVMRKSLEIPELSRALAAQRLTVSKAARIVSALSAENAVELVEFAVQNSTRAINEEVARRDPQAAAIERIRPLAEDLFEVRIHLSREVVAKLRRDQGRCTHRDSAGMRCSEDRWVHIHHIKPVSEGGSNDPDNLTTLCWFHHDQLHRRETTSPSSRPLLA